jgi:hypothetical protein
MLKKKLLPLVFCIALFLTLTSCESFASDGRVWISDSKDHSSAESGDLNVDASKESEDLSPIVNTSSKRIHLFFDCSHVSSIKAENKKTVDASEIDAYLDQGYEICKSCSKRDTKTSE